jgi:hypothetical protein
VIGQRHSPISRICSRTTFPPNAGTNTFIRRAWSALLRQQAGQRIASTTRRRELVWVIP